MFYQTYIPHPLLQRYIKCYWSLEIGAMREPSRERVLPDGCTELIFHYGDLFRKYAAGKADWQPRSFVHGQIASFIELEASGRTGIFAVRFQPGGLKAFIPGNITETTGEHVAIEDIWGKTAGELEDRILNAGSQLDRVAMADHFLLNKMDHAREDRLVDQCVHIITNAKGNLNMEELAAQLYISRRQLEKRFVGHVGLSPKQFSRINRFRYILDQIEGQRFSSLTSLAYEGGFYDQAHFIKDFKAFTGLSPRRYFAANLDLSRHFSQE